MPAVRDQLAKQITDPYLPGKRIASADLYWVTPDMTTVSLHAADSLDEWTPGAAVPSESGLLLWDSPDTPKVPVHTLPPELTTTNFFGQPVLPQLPIAGVLWAATEVEVLAIALIRTQAIPEKVRDAVANRFPVVAPACTLPLMPTSSATSLNVYYKEVRPVMRLVATTWLLMGQPALAAARPLSARDNDPRPTAEPKEPDVSIIEPRRSHAAPTDPEETGEQDLARRHQITQDHETLATAMLSAPQTTETRG